jgi:hypothetical protein
VALDVVDDDIAVDVLVLDGLVVVDVDGVVVGAGLDVVVVVLGGPTWPAAVSTQAPEWYRSQPYWPHATPVAEDPVQRQDLTRAGLLGAELNDLVAEGAEPLGDGAGGGQEMGLVPTMHETLGDLHEAGHRAAPPLRPHHDRDAHLVYITQTDDQRGIATSPAHRGARRRRRA